MILYYIIVTIAMRKYNSSRLPKSPVIIVAQLKLPLQLDKFLMFEDLEEWNFKIDT